MVSDQKVPDRHFVSRRPRVDDELRGDLAAAANVIAFIASAIVYWILLQQYYTTNWMIIVPWAGLLLMALYFGWMITRFPRIRNSVRRMQGDEVPEDPPVQGKGAWLYLGSAINITILAWLVVATGGIQRSPFAPYGLALIVFSQFLSDAPATYWALMVLGVVWYVLLLAVPWAVEMSQSAINLEALARDDTGMRWACGIVGASIVVMGSAVVRYKPIFRKPK